MHYIPSLLTVCVRKKTNLRYLVSRHPLIFDVTYTSMRTTPKEIIQSVNSVLCCTEEVY